MLITGEGSHQLTAQEICQFHRLGLRPIIFVLNNSGYLIERMLCKDPDIGYNDVASWNYAELPHALGCEGWFTQRVTTLGQLGEALATASQGERASYIEVVTGTYEAPALAKKLHDNVKNPLPLRLTAVPTACRHPTLKGRLKGAQRGGCHRASEHRPDARRSSDIAERRALHTRDQPDDANA